MTPPDDQKHDEKGNCADENLLPCLSAKWNDHLDTCSTPNTFLETPSNCDFDDSRFNQSITSNEKVISILKFQSTFFRWIYSRSRISTKKITQTLLSILQ